MIRGIRGISIPWIESRYELPCFACETIFEASNLDPTFLCPACRTKANPRDQAPPVPTVSAPKISRDDVRQALDPIAVAAHCGIELRWSGRWGRSRRCARTDHGTHAFALSREGMWHCHGCGDGGDLFHLIAAAERLDVRADFPRILEIAAAIAGVEPEEDDFGPVKPRATRPQRPAPPPAEPLDERIAKAAARGAWLWDRCIPLDRAARMYLNDRALGSAHLDLEKMLDIRCAPIRMSITEAKSSDAAMTIFRMWGAPGIAVPVRHIETGAILDVRCRRYDVKDEPKVIGMLGGVTTHSTETGAELVACYGNPHKLGKSRVMVVEGLADMLTAAALWPDADVLGAVDAAQYPLVAGFAASYCARSGASLVLIAQEDLGPFVKNGEKARHAADQAVDRAGARAILAGVIPLWLECAPHKDLNRWHVRDRGGPQRKLEAVEAARKEEGK